jgi:hypothetical protein
MCVKEKIIEVWPYVVNSLIRFWLENIINILPL